MNVILQIHEKINTVEQKIIRVDITNDIVEGSLDRLQIRMGGVGLFEVEANAINMELNNHERYYYSTGGMIAKRPIRGSNIPKDGGVNNDDWRVEKIIVIEEGRLRYLGFIFNDDNVIAYDPEMDIISFTMYDSMYLLKKFMMSRENYTNYNNSALAHLEKQRYVKEFELINEDESVQNVEYFIDKPTFDELPEEEQVSWVKQYVWDTYGNFLVETHNKTYEAIELQTLTLIAPAGLYAYRRKIASIPIEINIVDTVIPTMLEHFNNWMPAFNLHARTTDSDVDNLMRKFLIQLNIPNFNKISLDWRTVGVINRYLAATFENDRGDNTDDNQSKSVRIHEFYNKVVPIPLLDAQFPTIPPVLGEGLITLHIKYETLRGTFDEYIDFRFDLTSPGSTEYIVGSIRNPGLSQLFVVYRMVKRRYTRRSGFWITTGVGPSIFHDFMVRWAQYSYQYYVIDLTHNSLHGPYEKDIIYKYITGVPDSLCDSDMGTPDYNTFNSLKNITGWNVSLTTYEQRNIWDSNALASWPLDNYRYYSPTEDGPGLFLYAQPTMNKVGFDYRDKNLGEILLDLSKISNSAFRVNAESEDIGGFIFGNRRYGHDDIVVDRTSLVDHKINHRTLDAETPPEISQEIIESDSYNKALTRYYDVFYGSEVEERIVEVVRDDILINKDYNLLWRLLINGELIGIIYNIDVTTMTVRFGTKNFIPASSVCYLNSF